MQLKNCLVVSATILLSLTFLSAGSAFAAGSASITLSPLSGSYKAGQTFNMNISVNPGSDKVDMVRAKITFPADLLMIKNFSTSPTFSYQAGSNGFDNAAGTFSWGAGTPGGITAPSNFGTITFSVKKAGPAQISVSNGSLALSSGVDKFNGQLSSASITLLAAAAAPKPKESTVTPPAETPAVETQIIPNQQSQGFVAALMNALSLATAIRILAFAAVLLVLLFLGFTIYKIATKPEVNYKSNKK